MTVASAPVSTRASSSSPLTLTRMYGDRESRYMLVKMASIVRCRDAMAGGSSSVEYDPKLWSVGCDDASAPVVTAPPCFLAATAACAAADGPLALFELFEPLALLPLPLASLTAALKTDMHPLQIA
eukprot:Amastigsp_a842619_46.p4 type:complete len:126 gc:universal Amastigsp_a842619_46:794-417(-)